jgi:hypothetical protein
MLRSSSASALPRPGLWYGDTIPLYQHRSLQILCNVWIISPAARSTHSGKSDNDHRRLLYAFVAPAQCSPSQTGSLVRSLVSVLCSRAVLSVGCSNSRPSCTCHTTTVQSPTRVHMEIGSWNSINSPAVPPSSTAAGPASSSEHRLAGRCPRPDGCSRH